MHDDHIPTTVLPHRDALEKLKHDAALRLRARHLEDYLRCVAIVEAMHPMDDVRQWVAEEEEAQK